MTDEAQGEPVHKHTGFEGRYEEAKDGTHVQEFCSGCGETRLGRKV